MSVIGRGTAAVLALPDTWANLLQILHLCAWAQLGTLARVYLGKLFGGSCQIEGTDTAWSWIPCVTSPGTRIGGALFQDLPANVLGSFAMGLLSTSDTLAAIFHDPSTKGTAVALLPPHSVLQGHTRLAIGLRTGFCGSLTTFSSWMLQMTVMMVGGSPSQGLGTQWVAALWGMFLGTSLSVTALYMGQQAAMYMYSCHTRRPDQATAANSDADAADPVGRSEVLVQVRPAVVAASSDANANNSSPMLELATITTPHPTPPSSWPCILSDVAAVAVLATLTGVSVAYSIKDCDAKHGASDARRYFWFSLCFGPAGCLLRWQLAKLNGTLPRQLAWFPIGTFAANTLAILLDDVMQVLIVRVALTSLQRSIVEGIITGVGGCLSTVSTWVVEVQRLDLEYPTNSHSYAYAGCSLFTATILGLAIYGTAVWSM